MWTSVEGACDLRLEIVLENRGNCGNLWKMEEGERLEGNENKRMDISGMKKTHLITNGVQQCGLRRTT